jgi:hypothetical protein
VAINKREIDSSRTTIVAVSVSLILLLVFSVLGYAYFGRRWIKQIRNVKRRLTTEIPSLRELIFGQIEKLAGTYVSIGDNATDRRIDGLCLQIELLEAQLQQQQPLFRRRMAFPAGSSMPQLPPLPLSLLPPADESRHEDKLPSKSRRSRSHASELPRNSTVVDISFGDQQKKQPPAVPPKPKGLIPLMGPEEQKNGLDNLVNALKPLSAASESGDLASSEGENGAEGATALPPPNSMLPIAFGPPASRTRGKKPPTSSDT